MDIDTDAGHGRTGDRWTVFGMLVIFSFLLGLVIFLGWERLIRPFAQSTSLFFAALVTGLALLVARHIGVRWHLETQQAREEGRPASYRWLLFYPAFFFISALGVINVAFYHLEGPIVLKQSMEDSGRAFSALSATAQSELRDVAHEEKMDRVHQLIRALTTEILSPTGYCGVGRVARSTIADIQKILPSFKEIAGSASTLGGGRVLKSLRPASRRRISFADCNTDRLRALADAYRVNAEDQLANDPDYARERGPEREALLKKIGDDAADANRQFNVANGVLDGSEIADRSAAYQTALAALDTANRSYGDDREHLDKLTAKTHPLLPVELDLTAAKELGSFTSVLHLLASRLNRFTTWFYLLIAVLMDFAVLGLVKQAQNEFSGTRRRSKYARSYTSVTTGKSTGPRFLWVNPEEAD